MSGPHLLLIAWVVLCLAGATWPWASRLAHARRTRRAEQRMPLAPVIQLGPAQAARDRRRQARRAS